MKGNPEITFGDIKCEECDKKYKKLQTHIIRTHQMTMAVYKEKWGYFKEQPLEAGYITKKRRESNKKHKGYKNLTDKYNFKKGYKSYWKNKKQPLQWLKRRDKKGRFTIKG